MKTSDAKFFSAELGAKIPTLDLHGFYPVEALDKMEIFLYDCSQKNEDMCRIVYGGGTGKLQEEILKEIQTHPLVKEFKEQGGSCVVLI